jgi:hypothetical protein
MRRALALVLVSLAVAAFSGCGSEGAACYPTDWEACTCADATRGYHQCVAEGDGYGACDCSGATPGLTPVSVDGGPGDAAPDAAEGGALAPFLAICKVNADCESNVCFPFNSKGPHCTIACNADADCPAPSPGCSHMGVCKPP